MNFDAIFQQLKTEHQWDFTLKCDQKAVIEVLLQKKNVLAIYPIGYGKTLMHSITPLVLDTVYLRANGSYFVYFWRKMTVLRL
jgi:Lhr-like helicase